MTEHKVPCSCGHVFAGRRTARAKILQCPSCGLRRFILPFSPFASTHRASEGSPSGFWFWPIVGASVTLALVTVGLIWFFSTLTDKGTTAGSIVTREQLTQQIQKGRDILLKQHSFRVAADHLGIASQWMEQQPGLLSPAETLQARQWHRQAVLFSRLLRKESLEEILEEARRQIRDDEWRALFRENYQGGAVLFDDQLVENDQGQIELQWYSAQIGKVKARIEIPLKVLTKVDLGQPRRVIFGARLHSIQRGEGGVWIIRFDPDSGVLITEPELLRFVSGQPLDDETLRQVSEQRRWLNLSKEQP